MLLWFIAVAERKQTTAVINLVKEPAQAGSLDSIFHT